MEKVKFMVYKSEPVEFDTLMDAYKYIDSLENRGGPSNPLCMVTTDNGYGNMEIIAQYGGVTIEPGYACEVIEKDTTEEELVENAKVIHIQEHGDITVYELKDFDLKKVNE